MMNKKSARYERIYHQLQDLLMKSNDTIARMSTTAAVLHHKMEGFFWTGFYLFEAGELIVGPYQGPVACLKLEKNTGVCWAGINEGKTIVVPDVEKFPGHIACDPRSRSEIVIPVKNHQRKVLGVLDVDSNKLGQFDETDVAWLEKITAMIFLPGN
jgi:L-methionine (R)-S-oxide reductase